MPHEPEVQNDAYLGAIPEDGLGYDEPVVEQVHVQEHPRTAPYTEEELQNWNHQEDENMQPQVLIGRPESRASKHDIMQPRYS